MYADSLLAQRLLLYIGVLLLWLTLLDAAHVLFLYSGDESLYVEAGIRYLSGIPPAQFNFEHPPLAKYIIGACLPVGRFCPLLFGWAAVVAIGESGWLLGLRGSTWLGLVAAAALDPVIYSVSGLWLLDVFMLGFFALGLYLVLRLVERDTSLWQAFVAGTMLGAAFASKMLCLLPCVSLLAYIWRRRGSAFFAAAVAGAMLVYITSYASDFLSGGLWLVISHHRRMLEYMSERHGFELYLAAAGVLFYFAKLEIWGDIGTIKVTFVNGTLGNVTYMLHKPKPVAKFTPWLGSWILPLSPVAAVTVGGLPGLVHLASLWALVYGPIWWYLVLPTYTGHLVIALWLAKTMPRHGWLVHVASSLAAMCSVLPYLAHPR